MDEKIYLKILKLLGNYGTRFTTDDLAKELGTSKRTIYTYFSSKDEMIEKTIEFVFRDIIKSDAQILYNDTYSLPQKLKLYFDNIPDAYNLGAIIRHKDDLQRFYPDLWKKVNSQLETIWDEAIQLIETGIRKKELREINTVILHLMLNESLKKLLDYEFTAQNQVSFESGIKAMYDILLCGILKDVQ